MKDVLADAGRSDRLEEQTALAALEAKMFGTHRTLTVARYELGHRLGRGASGDVLLARDPKLDREVAIKLLRPQPGRRGAEGRRRFIREAQSIAALSHPNVVKVFDVGDFSWASIQEQASDDSDDERGVFIVMERVLGDDLQDWLTAQEHPWEEILLHFGLAGEGLIAAHAHGIVHRDFKPSNVLVSRTGAVKVVDFGLALVHGPGSSSELSEAVTGADRPLAGEGRLTEDGTVLGTPLFMAPEQHRGEPADARVDQYAFCASLYLALYGHAAFEGQTLAELAFAKQAGSPSRPPGTSVPVSIHRAISRGLCPDPGDRWPTMDALLRALQPPRSIKRPLVLAALGGAGLTIAVLAIPSSPDTSRCDPEHRIAQVWNDARNNALHTALEDTGLPYAQDTHARLGTALDTHTERWGANYRGACEDPGLVGKARDLRMQCLVRQLEELDVLLNVVSEGDPAVVERSVGAVSSLSAPRDCLDAGYVGAMVESPDDPDLAGHVERLRERMLELGALERLGRYATGMEMAREIAAEAERLGYPPLLADALLQRGSLEERAGDYETARTTLERAFFIAQPLPYPTVATRAATTLVWIYGHRLRRYEKAEQWGRHARAALEQLGTPPGEEADLLDILSAVDIDRGDNEQALERNLRALALNEHEGPVSLATSHNNVATALDALGRHGEALREYGEALELRREQLGPKHPAVATVLYNMGNTHWKAGELEPAIEAHRSALAIRENTLGPDHPRTAQSLNNIAAILSDDDQLEEAEHLMVRAQAIWEKTYGPDHPHVVGTIANLAAFRERRGDLAGARQSYARALSLARNLDEPNPALLLHILAEYARILAELGEHAEAVAHFEDGLAMHARTPGPDPTIGSLSLGLSRSLAATGDDPTRVRALAEEAIGHYDAAGAMGEAGLTAAREWRDSLGGVGSP